MRPADKPTLKQRLENNIVWVVLVACCLTAMGTWTIAQSVIQRPAPELRQMTSSGASPSFASAPSALPTLDDSKKASQPAPVIESVATTPSPNALGMTLEQ